MIYGQNVTEISIVIVDDYLNRQWHDRNCFASHSKFNTDKEKNNLSHGIFAKNKWNSIMSDSILVRYIKSIRIYSSCWKYKFHLKTNTFVFLTVFFPWSYLNQFCQLQWMDFLLQFFVWFQHEWLKLKIDGCFALKWLSTQTTIKKISERNIKLANIPRISMLYISSLMMKNAARNR